MALHPNRPLFDDGVSPIHGRYSHARNKKKLKKLVVKPCLTLGHIRYFGNFHDF